MANVLAFAEVRGGELRKVAHEVVTGARALADAAGGEVHAFVVGPEGIAGNAAVLGRFGADVIYVTEHSAFANSNVEATAAAVAERVRALSYRYVCFSASAQGKDLSPRVAAILGVPLAADLTDVRLEGEVVVATHP